LSTSTGLLLKKERKKPEGSSVMFNDPGNSRVYDPPRRRVSVWVKGKNLFKNSEGQVNDQQVTPQFTMD
jgi:hypothetical protein